MWTLTYADEPPDLRTVNRHLRWFQRQLLRVFGKLAHVEVVETGSERGRFHVHAGADRFLSIEGVRRCWPHGYVWVGDTKRIRGRMAVGQLARYLAKYITKDLDGLADDDPKGREDGGHRYLVAQGFQPEVISARVASAAKFLAGAMELLGEPDRVIAWDARPDVPAYGYWAGWPEDSWYHPP